MKNIVTKDLTAENLLYVACAIHTWDKEPMDIVKRAIDIFTIVQTADAANKECIRMFEEGPEAVARGAASAMELLRRVAGE